MHGHSTFEHFNSNKMCDTNVSLFDLCSTAVENVVK